MSSHICANSSVSTVLQELALDEPTAEIQFLRRIVSPLPSMIMATGGPARVPLPVSLGPRADAELVRRGVSMGFILRAFRARIHAPNRELFSFHLSQGTSWTVTECEMLWDLIEFPSL